MPVYVTDQPTIAQMEPVAPNTLFSEHGQQLLRNGYPVISEHAIRDGVSLSTTCAKLSSTIGKKYASEGGNTYIQGGCTIPGTNYVLGVMGISLFEHFIKWNSEDGGPLPASAADK